MKFRKTLLITAILGLTGCTRPDISLASWNIASELCGPNDNVQYVQPSAIWTKVYVRCNNGALFAFDNPAYSSGKTIVWDKAKAKE